MKTTFTVPLAALVLIGFAAVPSFAGDSEKQHASQHEIAREALRRGEILPLTRILPIVQQRVPGDVIKIKLDDDEKRIEYEVKVLTPNGRVIEVELDARSGRILKIEED